VIVDTKKILPWIGRHLFHLYAIIALMILFSAAQNLYAFENGLIKEGIIALKMMNTMSGALHTQT
jgi:hypothetical protein